MIKFNRQNIIKLSRELNISYICLDLLRQETIKRFIEQANKNKNNSKQVKNIIINNIKYLLDLIITEENA